MLPVAMFAIPIVPDAELVSVPPSGDSQALCAPVGRRSSAYTRTPETGAGGTGVDDGVSKVSIAPNEVKWSVVALMVSVVGSTDTLGNSTHSSVAVST